MIPVADMFWRARYGKLNLSHSIFSFWKSSALRLQPLSA
jgi:hypothetical protein